MFEKIFSDLVRKRNLKFDDGQDFKRSLCTIPWLKNTPSLCI